jgi:hypothetical protein
MRHPLDVSSRLAFSCIVLLALAGCGGGSSASTAPPAGNDPPPPPPVQAEIQGVATPSSVAVVTATNAQ